MLQLNPSILTSETPVYGGAIGIPLVRPGTDLALQRGGVGDATIQTLPAQCTELDLSHVKPTAMVGCVVHIDLAGNPMGFCRFEGLIERGNGVRVEVIHHQGDHFGGREMYIDQILHEAGPVQSGAMIRDGDIAPGQQGSESQKQIVHAMSFILAVVAQRLAGFHRQRLAHVGQHLFARLIHAHQRAFSIQRLRVQIQYLLHLTHESGTGLRRDTPFLFRPRLKFVFLSTWRTVSYEMASVYFSFTISLARSCKVQWSCPLGGTLHVKAIKCASPTPSSAAARWPVGARLSAPSNPRSTYRLRTLTTVMACTSTAAAMASSVHTRPSWLSSALSKIIARFISRTISFPEEVSTVRRSRSSLVNSTL